MTTKPKTERRTKASLALEAAALAYGAAEAAFRAEQDKITAEHVARTGSRMGALAAPNIVMINLRDAWRSAERRLGLAAKAFCRSKQKRRAG
jgi:hypothetical protein